MESSGPNPVQWNLVETDSLLRYAKKHDLPCSESSTREELLAAVSSHFSDRYVIQEDEAIMKFIYCLRKGLSAELVKKKRGRRATDQPPEPEQEVESDSGDKPVCICNDPDNTDPNMIACDNQTCPIGWFHLSCIGLSPKDLPDKWFCPSCSKII